MNVSFVNADKHKTGDVDIFYDRVGGYKKILSTNSCLHTLLPPERNNEVLSKLHCEPKKHIKMFVPYLLQNPVDSDKIWHSTHCPE